MAGASLHDVAKQTKIVVIYTPTHCTSCLNALFTFNEHNAQINNNNNVKNSSGGSGCRPCVLGLDVEWTTTSQSNVHERETTHKSACEASSSPGQSISTKNSNKNKLTGYPAKVNNSDIPTLANTSMTTTVSRNPVAVLQLATKSKCFIILLHKLKSLPKVLTNLLEDPR